MKIKVTLALCLIVSVYTCWGEKKTIQGTAFSGDDYTLNFPSTWGVKRGVMGTDLIGLSPLESPSDNFQENINVVVDNIPDSMSVSMFLQYNLDAMNKMYGLPEDASFSKVRVGSSDGYHLRYSARVGQLSLDNDCYIVLINKASYFITCSHISGKRDSYKSTVDSIISSFEVK